MARLAFCGLGQMGAPMAARLLAAGHRVVVWNRTLARADALVRQGASPAQTPAEAAAGADAVLTMLADPAALDAVVFGTDGLAEGFTPGATLIDASTVGVDAVRGIASRLGGTVQMMDAPVLGSVKQATEGTLKIFVGATPELFQHWAPVLEAMGTPSYFGPLGSGAAMKLVANSTLGSLMSALGEAMALAAHLGLEQAKVLDVLVGSPIGVTATSKRANIESGTYPPNFKLRLALKDLGLVLDAAAREDLQLPLVAAARAWFQQAAAAGFGEMDYSAVIAEITGGPAS